MLALTGCSNFQRLNSEGKVFGGLLVTSAVLETTSDANYGVTHGLISYGISHAAENVADQVFPQPEQEWAADAIAIVGAAIPAAYYVDRENGGSDDSKADWMFPVGNFLITLYRRLRYEQQ